MRRGTRAKPGLFERVWPDYPIGCKRILFSDDYLPALAAPNVDLVTQPVTRGHAATASSPPTGPSTRPTC